MSGRVLRKGSTANGAGCVILGYFSAFKEIQQGLYGCYCSHRFYDGIDHTLSSLPMF
jgi:hypothetical protein